MRISVSSVSRFEPCEFPSRVDRLPLSLSLHHLCFCLSSLSLCLPPDSLLFVRPFICTWPNLHRLFPEGHIKTPEFPPLRSLSVFRRRRLCLRAGRCATLPPLSPPLSLFQTALVKPFRIFYVCLRSPRLRSTNGLRVGGLGSCGKAVLSCNRLDKVRVFG